MVQPNYSPKEALNRVKLMMGYDPSNTLTENQQKLKSLINFRNTSSNFIVNLQQFDVLIY